MVYLTRRHVRFIQVNQHFVFLLTNFGLGVIQLLVDRLDGFGSSLGKFKCLAHFVKMEYKRWMDEEQLQEETFLNFRAHGRSMHVGTEMLSWTLLPSRRLDACV